MKYKQLLSGTTAALIFGLSTQAQESGTETLSPLNVLGNKYESPKLSTSLKSGLSVDEIPQSMTIMNEDRFEAQGLNSIGDIINYTPGVMNAQGEGHRDAVVIRGLRTTADFYLDGVRDDVQYYRPLYNVEQVEVLRGSNALLSSFGGGYGIVNRVSKKGLLGEDITTLQGSVDSFGEFNLQLDRNFDLDGKAFRINMFTDSLENHRDFYYGDSFGINPTLRLKLDEGFFDLSYEYLDQERFIDRGIMAGADGLPMKSYKDILFADATQNFSTHEAHIFRASLESKFSDTLTGRFKLTFNDHAKMYQNLYAADQTFNASEVKLDGYKDNTDRKSTIFSAELVGEVETGNIIHDLIAGIEYTTTDNDNRRYNTDFDPSAANEDNAAVAIASNLGIRDGTLQGTFGNTLGTITTLVNDYTTSRADQNEADVKIFSIFIQDELSITDKLGLMLGARFNKFEMDVNDVKAGGVKYSDTDEEISPRVALTYDISENASVYIGYSESVNPRTDEQYANFKDSNEPVLDPDTFETTELGISWNLIDGLSLSASVFEIKAKKPEELTPSPFTSIVVESETTGFEVGLAGSFTENWFFTASYAGLDATSDSGSRVAESPENMFSIWNNYLLSDAFSINLGVINYGDSLIKTNNTWTLPSYTRVDAGATYAISENTRLQLNIENLTDELYFPNAHGQHQITVGAPVNAMLSVTSSF